MDRLLMAKIIHFCVTNFDNSPAIACNLHLDLEDFISPSIQPRINQRLLKTGCYTTTSLGSYIAKCSY